MNQDFDLFDIVSLGFGLALAVFVAVIVIISLAENEKHAAKKSLLLIFFCIPFFIIPVLDFPYQNIVEIFLVSAIVLFGLILILPINNFAKINQYKINSRIDERDIMFSRNELIPESENHNNYYTSHPKSKQIDDDIKSKPGILGKESSYFNKILFSTANASFKTVECFLPFLESEINQDKTDLAPESITKYIKAWSKHLGARDCGITVLKDYHKYSHRGRRNEYGKPVELNHKYAIAITVEMNKKMMAAAPASPSVMESANQYLNAGAIAMQLAFFIKDLGHEALAHIDGNYQVICPLVAKDAGLGEIGRMGLLMTPKLGPRVRIAVVTTDLPLITDEPCFIPSVIDFCNICKKCADTCPGKAISDKGMENINGSLRWQINQEACFNYWVTCGTDCGRCMAVCPYSHPDNLLHNIIRVGLKNSYLFRRFALKMDNFLYERKPAPGKALKWIKEVSKTQN